MKKRIIIILLVFASTFNLLSCRIDLSGLSDASTPDGGETEHICRAEHMQNVPGEHASVCTVCNQKHLKPEAHSFVRENCEDTYVVCTVCGEAEEAPAENHDWEVEWVIGCWFANEVRTCKKCGETDTIHISPALPKHIWAEIASDGGLTTFKCTQCRESNIFISEIEEFSYAEVLENHKIGDPGVKHDSFHFNNLLDQIDDANEVVTRAKLVLKSHYTVEYDMISVSFDTESDVWCVHFFTLEKPDSGYSVYVRGTGDTCYIVCVE